MKSKYSLNKAFELANYHAPSIIFFDELEKMLNEEPPYIGEVQRRVREMNRIISNHLLFRAIRFNEFIFVDPPPLQFQLIRNTTGVDVDWDQVIYENDDQRQKIYKMLGKETKQ
jgi:hypothetical protein